MVWKLVIGNKNYSSWSLRAWLYLTEGGVKFDEVRIPLYVGDWEAQLKKVSPTMQVPVLLEKGQAVWDSLAIMSYVESKVGWPKDFRGEAMSAAHEMHSGFTGLRAEMPMNLKMKKHSHDLSDDAQRDVDRVKAIWQTALARHDGPYLYGDSLTITDVMYAPVVTRFISYGIPIDDPRTKAYMDAIVALAGMKAWHAAAIAETEIIHKYDALFLY